MSLTIPPLPPTQPQWGGFQVWWQLAKTAIEQANADLTTQVAAIAAAQAAAAAAQSTANTAVTNAATAQSTANTANSTANTANTTANAANTTATTVQRDDSISTSWTSPGSVLSATDAGANATIAIAAHTRKYSDATSVSVNSGSLTGRAYSTTYYVYYTQTSRAGGAVTYNSTTDPNVAQPNAAAGRHFVGKVTTPAAAGAPTSGGYTPPGGYSGPGEIP